MWYPQFSQKTNEKMKKNYLTMLSSGVSEEGGRGRIATPLFGRLKGAGGVSPLYYLHYYLPPSFRKPLRLGLAISGDTK